MGRRIALIAVVVGVLFAWAVPASAISKVTVKSDGGFVTVTDYSGHAAYLYVAGNQLFSNAPMAVTGGSYQGGTGSDLLIASDNGAANFVDCGNDTAIDEYWWTSAEGDTAACGPEDY